MRILTTVCSVAFVAACATILSLPAVESPAPGGAITGKVTFSGKAPENTPWTVGKNRKVCNNSKTLDRIMVDKAGGVANCFIIVKGVKGATAGMHTGKLEQRG